MSILFFEHQGNDLLCAKGVVILDTGHYATSNRTDLRIKILEFPSTKDDLYQMMETASIVLEILNKCQCLIATSLSFPQGKGKTRRDLSKNIPQCSWLIIRDNKMRWSFGEDRKNRGPVAQPLMPKGRKRRT
jgi:hypothetical protein